MSCDRCDVSIEADFPLQRLGQLPIEHQRFIEMFVLGGGSLKEIASQAGVSYPTVRSRLDRVIEALREVIAHEQHGSTETDAGSESSHADEPASIIKRI